MWANISHEIAHIGLHQFRARYTDKLAATSQLVIKRGETTVVTGRLTPRMQPKGRPTTKH